MSRIRRYTRAGAHAALVVAGWLAFGAGAVEPGSKGSPSDGGPRTVTLITGDQVVLTGGPRGTMSVRPRKGREQISFATHSEYSAYDERDHTYVIPADALALIGAGKLDRELFNVTALTAYPAVDGAIDAVPLIVTFQGGQQQRTAATSLLTAGASVTQTLTMVNGAAVSPSSSEAARWWDSLQGTGPAARSAPQRLDSSIEKIWLDRLLRPTLDRSAVQIGAPVAWASGYTGQGVFVAVIDTGVDATHPDLVGKVVASRNFVPPFLDPDERDLVGHGTHVASTIAGSGAASGGRYRGIAPGVSLISGKVCALNGCPLSSIMAGMEWAVMEQGARIVNMSLGGPDFPTDDPMETTVNRLTADYGALFVVSAGNSGQGGAFTVSSPSTATAALSVAAVDRDNRVAIFSSRGPRVGDRGAKPEIAAPGVGIVAARASQGVIGTPVGDSYVALSGTSMAAPHVVGAAALLGERYPQWGHEQLKAALTGSAEFSSGMSIFDYGAGTVDVAAAFATHVTAEPASLSLGVARWPHDDDDVIIRTVSYRNSGTQAATLALQIAATGLGGQTPPAGLFSISPRTLTLPAGGTATATITVDTRVSGTTAIFGGRLIATDADGRTIVTPVAIDHEEESYNLVLRHIDTQGGQALHYQTHVIPLDRSLPYNPSFQGVAADVTLRLPAGRYAVYHFGVGTLPIGLPDFSAPTLIGKPIHVLNSDAVLSLDQRRAAKLDVRSPTKTAAIAFTELWIHQPITRDGRSGKWIGGVANFAPNARWSTAQLSAADSGLMSHFSSQWTDATQTEPNGAPALYAATWITHGALPTGRKAVKNTDWAVVEARYASPFASISEGRILTVADLIMLPLGVDLPVSLPGKRTEYYYANDPLVRWGQTMTKRGVGNAPPLFTFFDYENWRYKAGSKHSKRWLEPVLGPLAEHVRNGERLLVGLTLHSDRSGRPGWIGGDQAQQIALYANGQEVDRDPQGSMPPWTASFRVAAEPTTYRLESSHTQNLSGWSTHVKGVWTFDSEQTAEETTVALPTVRFEPSLNERGQAYRGVPQWVPIEVQHLGEPDSAIVSHLKVEVSYDDGSTWRRAFAKRAGKKWIALIEHPKQGNHVSLRAATRDWSGASVEQTTIRAYGLTERPKPGKTQH